MDEQIFQGTGWGVARDENGVFIVLELPEPFNAQLRINVTPQLFEAIKKGMEADGPVIGIGEDAARTIADAHTKADGNDIAP